VVDKLRSSNIDVDELTEQEAKVIRVTDFHDTYHLLLGKFKQGAGPVQKVMRARL